LLMEKGESEAVVVMGVSVLGFIYD